MEFPHVGALIDKLGFFGIDLGPIAVGGSLPALNLVRFG